MRRSCRYGAGCTRADCYFSHPPGHGGRSGTADGYDGAAPRPCRYGASCTRADCHFAHPPCHRSGAGDSDGHSLGRPRAPATKCPICLQRRALIAVGSCGHAACHGCLREQLAGGGRLSTLASYPLRCFAPECRVELARSLLKDRRLLQGDVDWATFRRFSTLAAARDDPGRRAVHCPGCDEPQLVPADGKGWSTRTCRNKRCSRTDFEVAPLVNATKSTFWFLHTLTDGDPADGFKQCPACNILISKEGGCRYVQCGCGHEFNWRSGKDWNDGTMEYTR